MSKPVGTFVVACALAACSRAFGGTPDAAQGIAPRAAVADANVRFQFLTPSLVRMEYSPSGAFVDMPTAVVQKRDWPPVKVESTQKDGWLILDSGAMTLRYRLHSGPFAAANLVATWNPAGVARQWHPGDSDPQNLGGLTYSLDNISNPNLPTDGMDLASPVNDVIPGIEVLLQPALPGLLSRSGYAFIDDTRTPVWNSQKTWIEPRAQQDGQDWYLFTYDRDYASVLQQYAQLCGAIPMIPRYTLGAWVTDFNFEYFPDSFEAQQAQFLRYNQKRLEDEVSRLRGSHIPFDTLVLDFAWHNYGWDGGFDWSPLFPHPDQLVRWLHGRGIKLSLNDHPGYANTDESILSFADSHAPAALKALGRPLPETPSFDLDISKDWTFAEDPNDRGLEEHWFDAKSPGARWTPIRVDRPWQAQGRAAYHGIAWYRAAVKLPAQIPAALYLHLGEVAGSYRIFVNGSEATHSAIRWPQRLTYTDIAPYLKAGQTNTIVLRIVSGAKRGGLMRGPVAIRDVKPPERIYFDLSNEQQAEASMRELHEPLMRQGVDSWWVDGGGGAVDMPGLNKQMWTNKVFYDFTAKVTAKRGFILGRYGDWGSERYPAFFTGDTYSEWPVLAYEVAYSVRGGNVLVPYISHDIGGFHGKQIPFDLYARWIEFGTFSPILRMHSAHANPDEGNLRMPWLYGDQGVALMKKYFTLHTQLIPYVYTYTWQAHKQSLPLMRPLYLAYPDLEESYRHPHEYFYGDEMLVAPVLDASGDVDVYLPPGRWLDFFSGKHYDGGTTFTAHYAADATPVFVRDGSIIPEQPVSDYSDAKPLDTLIVNVYGADAGHFDLYEDDGASLEYTQGRYALTPIAHAMSSDGTHELVIEPSNGTFSGQVQTRGYEIRIHAASKPTRVSVDGHEAIAWNWNAQDATAIVAVPARSIRQATRVAWR
jgi:alpha-glucosidase (family GH31 glycosyl hydrolase)